MPIYEYQCSDCSCVFDKNKKISERDEVSEEVCPECARVGSVKRLLASPLVAYSVTSNGSYGSKVPEGFKDVLRKIDERSPGSRMKETSSFL